MALNTEYIRRTTRIRRWAYLHSENHPSDSLGRETCVKYVLGLASIAFGLFVCFAAPPLTIVPGLAAIGGGFRVMTGSGSL